MYKIQRQNYFTKEIVLLAHPPIKRVSDFYKILKSYVEELQEDYEVISLYSKDQYNFFNGYLDIEHIVHQDIYSIKVDEQIFEDNIKKSFITMCFDDMFCDALDLITVNTNKIYIPTIIDKSKERLKYFTDNLHFTKNFIDISNYDETNYIDWFKYSFNVFGRYGIKTVDKPYLYFLNREDNELTESMKKFIELNRREYGI